MLKIIGICGSVSETVTCCAQLGVQSRRAPPIIWSFPAQQNKDPFLFLPPARHAYTRLHTVINSRRQFRGSDHPFRGGKPPFRPSVGNPRKPFLVRPTGLIVVSLLFPQLQLCLLTSMAHQKRNAHCVQLDSQQPVKAGLLLRSVREGRATVHHLSTPLGMRFILTWDCQSRCRVFPFISFFQTPQEISHTPHDIPKQVHTPILHTHTPL